MTLSLIQNPLAQDAFQPANRERNTVFTQQASALARSNRFGQSSTHPLLLSVVRELRPTGAAN